MASANIKAVKPRANNHDDAQTTLLAALRAHGPETVRCYTGTEYRDVAVLSAGKKRRRWVNVIEAVESFPWTRLELLDKAGRVLAALESDSADGPATDLEELTAPGMTGPVSEARAIVGLSQIAVRDAMSHRSEEFSSLLRAQTEVMQTCMGMMREMVAFSSHRVTQERELATVQAERAATLARIAEAAKESEDGLEGFLKQLPELMKLLPMLKALTSSGTPKPKSTNGVNGTPKPDAPKES